MLKVGDEVVHQSHPGRFRVIALEERPKNLYSDVVTIRNAQGVEMRVLDTAVRALESEPEAAAEVASGETIPASATRMIR